MDSEIHHGCLHTSCAHGHQLGTRMKARSQVGGGIDPTPETLQQIANRNGGVAYLPDSRIP